MIPCENDVKQEPVDMNERSNSQDFESDLAIQEYESNTAAEIVNAEILSGPGSSLGKYEVSFVYNIELYIIFYIYIMYSIFIFLIFFSLGGNCGRYIFGATEGAPDCNLVIFSFSSFPFLETICKFHFLTQFSLNFGQQGLQ